jgi:phage gpG-like protein
MPTATAAAVEITDDDLGWSRTRYALEALAGLELTIGVHGKDRERSKGDPLTNPELAAVHEFGADFEQGGRRVVIPARSFLRATVDEKGDAIGQVIDRAVDDVAELRKRAATAMSDIGLEIQGMIQQRIADGIGPPLQPATIKRKKSSKPLIDTGQLRQSITFVVKAKGPGGGDA